MDVSLRIRERLKELRLDQKDLAKAVQVTESYVSQLLTRKKAPPSPTRTDIYDKVSEFLGLSDGELAKLAESQRHHELRKKVGDAPGPLFGDFRELIIRKCAPNSRAEIRRIFEREAFGELERLITQKLLDVAQSIAKNELKSENWLRVLAHDSHLDYEQMRVLFLEFLDADIFDVSLDNCVTFLDPMIESWNIDLKTFSVEIILNQRLAPGGLKRFEFVETGAERPVVIEPGFERFLADHTLSGNITEEEKEFLQRLKFRGRHPSPLYYYRELQNLRDPLHFEVGVSPK